MVLVDSLDTVEEGSLDTVGHSFVVDTLVPAVDLDILVAGSMATGLMHLIINTLTCDGGHPYKGG